MEKGLKIETKPPKPLFGDYKRKRFSLKKIVLYSFVILGTAGIIYSNKDKIKSYINNIGKENSEKVAHAQLKNEKKRLEGRIRDLDGQYNTIKTEKESLEETVKEMGGQIAAYQKKEDERVKKIELEKSMIEKKEKAAKQDETAYRNDFVYEVLFSTGNSEKELILITRAYKASGKVPADNKEMYYARKEIDKQLRKILKGKWTDELSMNYKNNLIDIEKSTYQGRKLPLVKRKSIKDYDKIGEIPFNEHEIKGCGDYFRIP